VAESTITLFEAISVGALRSHPSAGEQAIDELMVRLAPLRSEVVADARNYLMASYMYMYRDLSAGELEAFADFMESEESRAIHAAFFDAINERYQAAGESIGARLAELMMQERI
jgi:hypothetical protein